MNKIEHKAISKVLSPSIADKFKELEEAIDDHFLKVKKQIPSQYKVVKKIVQDILIKEMLVLLPRKIIEYQKQQKQLAKSKNLMPQTR